ncbi:cuticle protein AM1159-like isoform X2 [Homarus americanus]|uniref:cuticle protein AM1159-like isoform X1 n=1 Tax=Homarus americanus TaxID=6706 RepID=UPI001C473A2E|nr:cuticle protein AM1159-like isoform X1 [Homarus americanus]XP_042222787.1 cuticle protein AM1159-like isoform X2 [Homarus americanus]
MKLVLLACLAALAVAAPQFENAIPVLILRDDRVDNGDGNFNYAFESDDGIAIEASGSSGSVGQSNIQGTIRFILPDGTPADLTYVADENGYQPQGALLPTPHPLPAHAQEQLLIADEQRAAGITFDQRGFRVNRK